MVNHRDVDAVISGKFYVLVKINMVLSITTHSIQPIGD